MAATVALSALALLILFGLGWTVLRHERADETERFQRAREITTSWAEPGPHYLTVPDSAPPAEPEPAASDTGRDGAAHPA
jgi:hypothetical protein